MFLTEKKLSNQTPVTERQKQEERKWSVNHLEIVEIVLDNVIKLISLKYFSSK